MPHPLTDLLAPEARALLRHAEAVFAEAGAEAYLVGGTIRDALLGLPLTETDVTADGDALTLADILAARANAIAVPLDREHGVARVVAMRADGTQSHMDIARMQGGSLEADLRRRDFTVNAIALPLGLASDPDWQGHLIDPLGGVADLQERRLRLASPTALSDDPARLLRAIRFAAHRSLERDSELNASLAANAHLLARVAPDRLRDELLLILEAPDPTAALYDMDSRGLLTRLIPELEPARSCEQPREHYWDVLEHTLQCVGFAARLLCRQGLPDETLDAVPWDDDLARHFDSIFAHGHPRSTYVKLACLFHDIAKPATKTIQPDGRIRFFGHSELGAQTAADVLRRLRFSGKVVRHIALMVEEHLRPTQLASRGELPTRRAIWRYYRDLGDAAIDTLYLSLADHLAARGPDFEFPRWQRHATLCNSVLRYEPRQAEPSKPRLVTGRDLMEHLGIPPGPLVGRLLEAVEEAVGSGEATTREEALAVARRTYSRHHAAHSPRNT